MDQRYGTPVMQGGYATDPGSGDTDPATQRLQDATGGLVDQAREAAVTQANTGVEAATDRLQHVAQAVRQTSQSLREQEQPQIAMIAEKAADQVERASGYFAGKDVRQLVGEVERVARREPVLFVAGGLTLGLIAARLLKSTPTSGGSSSSSRAMQTYSTPTYPSGMSTYEMGSGYGQTGSTYGQTGSTYGTDSMYAQTGSMYADTGSVAAETPWVADELEITDQAAGHESIGGQSDIEAITGIPSRQNDG